MLLRVAVSVILVAAIAMGGPAFGCERGGFSIDFDHQSQLVRLEDYGHTTLGPAYTIRRGRWEATGSLSTPIFANDTHERAPDWKRGDVIGGARVRLWLSQ